MLDKNESAAHLKMQNEYWGNKVRTFQGLTNVSRLRKNFVINFTKFLETDKHNLEPEEVEDFRLLYLFLEDVE